MMTGPPADGDVFQHAGRPPGLPMPVVPALYKTDVAYCVITTIDGSGRLADRSAVRALGWRPASRLEVSVDGGVGRVTPAGDGRLSVAMHGHVRLPAAVRHLLGVTGGDRVLVATRPEQDAVLVYPMPVVIRLLAAFDDVDASA
jgi:hypothetical protein